MKKEYATPPTESPENMKNVPLGPRFYFSIKIGHTIERMNTVPQRVKRHVPSAVSIVVSAA